MERRKTDWQFFLPYDDMKCVIRLCDTLYDGLNMRRGSTRCSEMRSEATLQRQPRYISSWNLLVITGNTRTFALLCVWIVRSAWGNLPADISSLQISPYPLTMEGGSRETRQGQHHSVPVYGRLSYWPIGAVRHSSKKSIKSTHHVEVNLTFCPHVSCPDLLIVFIWRFIF
jgi:hypothetical protein